MSTALEAIRNVAFVGHPSSGKTTLVDALAFQIGVSSRQGKVADKTSICDTEPEEQEKQHTLQLAVVQGEHKGTLFTFMDTPGYPDFISDANAAMSAADMVIGVVSAGGAVSFNLRNKMQGAQRLGRGRAVVMTHLDGDNADFDAMVEELRQKIGEVCVPILMPDQSGPGFSSVHTVFEESGGAWKPRVMDRVMDACEDEDADRWSYLETQ